MIPAANLASALRKASTAQREILAAIEHTRLAVIALGGELAALIATLPREDVAALGLGVSVMLRGSPTVDAVPGLTIEYLPAIDNEGSETRPGATSLFLEAAGTGQARVFLEVRSSPGQIVLAAASMRELDDWLEPVRGIILDSDSRVRLVLEDRRSGHEARLRTGPDAATLLESFLEALGTELKRCSRFNRAVDL
jgi:hypothetical protein